MTGHKLLGHGDKPLALFGFEQESVSPLVVAATSRRIDQVDHAPGQIFVCG
jgi:hypothetical protein